MENGGKQSKHFLANFAQIKNAVKVNARRNNYGEKRICRIRKTEREED